MLSRFLSILNRMVSKALRKHSVIHVYGYHGTSADNADCILRHGFRASENDYDWLGTGIYFFQDAPQRAWEWAEGHHRNPAILCALIEVSDFIDLLDIGWFEILSESYHLLVDEYARSGRLPPRQNQASGAHRLDYAVMNYAIEEIIKARYNTTVCGVRAAFPEGTPVFENSALFDRTHVQIAVRDSSAIKDVWLEKGV